MICERCKTEITTDGCLCSKYQIMAILPPPIDTFIGKANIIEILVKNDEYCRDLSTLDTAKKVIKLIKKIKK